MIRFLREHLPDRNLWVIYATMMVLSTAYGIALAVLPIVLEERRLGHEVVGELASWFALGLVLFALPSGLFVRWLTARWTLVISILGYAAMIGILPLLRGYSALAADRFVDGLFSMGAWMSAETLVLWRSTRENKALATSLSATFTMFGYLVGPVLSFLVSGWVKPEMRFFVAGGIAVVAAVICAVFLDPDPPESHRHAETPAVGDAPEVEAPPGPLGAIGLAWRIRVSCVATFVSGFFQASAALFVPRYLALEKGVPGEKASLVVAFAAAGMLLISNFAARAGDRFGHIRIMRLLAVAGVLGMLALLPLQSFVAMGLMLVVAGGCISSMPPLSLALQGVIVCPAEYPRSNSIFNVFFACGLVIGPWATGRMFSEFGGSAIVFLFAALWALFVVVTLLFRRDDPRWRRT
ncbi:MAG: MFS transporter [Verrucomicrobiales bacterium]|nr:MFS transporter [Verrucomicrobiales bacterium]